MAVKKKTQKTSAKKKATKALKAEDPKKNQTQKQVKPAKKK